MDMNKNNKNEKAKNETEKDNGIHNKGGCNDDNVDELVDNKWQ